jgi:hypothetical protein
MQTGFWLCSLDEGIALIAIGRKFSRFAVFWADDMNNALWSAYLCEYFLWLFSIPWGITFGFIFSKKKLLFLFSLILHWMYRFKLFHDDVYFSFTRHWWRGIYVGTFSATFVRWHTLPKMLRTATVFSTENVLHTHTHIYINTHIYKHIHTHTYIYIYIHTHTHIWTICCLWNTKNNH